MGAFIPSPQRAYQLLCSGQPSTNRWLPPPQLGLPPVFPCDSFQRNTTSLCFVKTNKKTPKHQIHMWVKRGVIDIYSWTTVINLVCPGLIGIYGCIRVHQGSLHIHYIQKDLLWSIDSCDYDHRGWKICKAHVPVRVHRLEAAVEPWRAEIPVWKSSGRRILLLWEDLLFCSI